MLLRAAECEVFRETVISPKHLSRQLPSQTTHSIAVLTPLWRSVCRPAEQYVPWFSTVLKAAHTAVAVLGLLIEETRASRLSFSVRGDAAGQDDCARLLATCADSTLAQVFGFPCLHAKLGRIWQSCEGGGVHISTDGSQDVCPGRLTACTVSSLQDVIRTLVELPENAPGFVSKKVRLILGCFCNSEIRARQMWGRYCKFEDRDRGPAAKPGHLLSCCCAACACSCSAWSVLWWCTARSS